MIWYGGDMGWWGYAAMGIGMALFWALLIGGIAYLIRLLTANDSSPTQPPTAEQVLATRFAHGELSESEYRDRLQILRS